MKLFHTQDSLDTCVKKANVSCTHKTLISHRSSDKRLRLKSHIWIFVTMCNGPAVNPLGPNLVHIVRDCGARACAPPCPFACAHVARMYACIGVCIVHRPTGCSAPKLYFQNVWFEKEIALTRSACKVLVFGKLRRIFNNFSVFFAMQECTAVRLLFFSFTIRRCIYDSGEYIMRSTYIFIAFEYFSNKPSKKYNKISRKKFLN